LTKIVVKKKYYCPVELTLDVLSGKWKGPILWWLGQESFRFTDLKQLMPGLSSEVLSTRLKELEKQGLVERKTYKEKPPRVEYMLTPLGKELSELTAKMCEMGKKINPNEKFVYQEVLDSLR
jgi:DNA-binding HxlR family transcriptional regulator